MQIDCPIIRAKILADPLNDAPRHEYADWLAAHGERWRAAFIEWMLENPNLIVAIHACGNETGGNVELHGRYGQGPAGPLAYGDTQYPVFFNWVSTHIKASMIGLHPAIYSINRGMIRSLWCDFEFWLSHGVQLVESHPITRVHIHNRHPVQLPDDSFKWISGKDCWMIPEEFNIGDREYNHRGETDTALSQACIAWAKRSKI